MGSACLLGQGSCVRYCCLHFCCMGGCTRECCSTASVIEWFKAIKNKKHHSFICFNIEEFYLSINQYLLNRSLDFTSAYNNITDNKRNIITHAKQSILVHKQQPWQNKGETSNRKAKKQKTSKKKYAASLTTIDYGSPLKPTNRPSIY